MKEEDRLSKKIGAAMKDIVVNKKELKSSALFVRGR